MSAKVLDDGRILVTDAHASAILRTLERAERAIAEQRHNAKSATADTDRAQHDAA